ncbi:MAG: lamin tail domain-containing protein, partial [Sphingobacteriales bacterium]
MSIPNNDNTGGENPYVFAIEGTGDCDTATNSVTPVAGPAGTEVTITATSNNLNGATAAFNAAAAVTTQVSASQVTVIIPSGAVTGNLTTTNSQGCSASNAFVVYDDFVTGCEGGAVVSSLFISEVTDSNSGGLNYVEIYNPTASTINLSGYSLRVASNGAATYGGTFNLSGTIASHATFVVALGYDGSTACPVPGGNGSKAALVFAGGGVNFNSNQHDHIALFGPSGQIDSWGVFGVSSWAPGFIGTRGARFSRKPTATVPSVTYSNADWDIVDVPGTSCSANDYSSLGPYDFSKGTPPAITQQPVISAGCRAITITVAAQEGFTGSNPLAYQWFAVAPGATNWTQLTNSGVFSNVNGAILNISDISTLAGYQFYCQVRENTASCYTASNAVKLGPVTTVSWNGSTWTPSLPDATKVATINGVYNTSTSGSFSACSLTVASGTLTVNSGNYVSVTNDLTVNSGATMQVLDNASLVMVSNSGVVTNNGTMRMERESTPFLKFDYTYWSSPMTNAILGTTFTGWRTDYAFYFDTANFSDISPADGYDDNGNVWTTASGTLVKGRGYAVMGPTTAASYPISPTVAFSGTYNNGVISHPLQMSANAADNFDDFNLIGNPYPSALLANQFVSDNADISGTLYFWTHRTPIAPASGTNNFITSDYAMYT